MLACLEYSEAMIDVGREVCAGTATWLRADAFILPFGESFDLVYSFRLLRHFRRPDRDRLYAEIRRVLRPGGFFLMDAVNERLSRPLREAHPAQYLIYDKLYRPYELRTELGTAGFDTVRLEPVQKCYRWQYASQVLLGPRANLLNRLVIRGLERLPRPDGLEWIVTCRRG
jgi:ubiquinone/menaquinone biosynthesis C-methylase UbiE